MGDDITSALERIENLTGDELQREIAKEVILVRGNLADIYQLLIEIKAQVKKE